jgi:hypothetical protein
LARGQEVETPGDAGANLGLGLLLLSLGRILVRARGECKPSKVQGMELGKDALSMGVIHGRASPKGGDQDQ